jgi:hypothetical protein
MEDARKRPRYREPLRREERTQLEPIETRLT